MMDERFLARLRQAGFDRRQVGPRIEWYHTDSGRLGTVDEFARALSLDPDAPKLLLAVTAILSQPIPSTDERSS
jgi:hypothetical protein